MSISSDDVNYLIYRYLQESGFHHAAFTFGTESGVINSNINGAEVASGCLISYLQKGLQYSEIETHLSENGQEVMCDEPFSLLSKHSCKKKSESLSLLTKQPKKELEDNDVKEVSIFDSKVTVLEGHNADVFICSWNPTCSMLASGSADATARLWHIPPDLPSGTESSNVANQSTIELKHGSPTEKSKDVTTLDWNSDGSLLATGCYDGVARIWSKKGELKASLTRHKGPIFSMRWNKKGDHLLSGSGDKTAIIWDVKTASVKQQFEFHTAPTLDLDWRDDTSFASCSTDKYIYVCELGKTQPLRAFVGHTDEVNTVRWDPTGNLLASCSDDCTAKVWSMKHEKYVHDFRHTKEIYTIRWSPTGPNTANPNKPQFLASSSFDATVRVWDIASGKEFYTFAKHSDPVYAISFSPNGEYLASGAFDKYLYIWSLKDGSLVKSFKGNGGIFEACWNSRGDRIAACFASKVIGVFDLRM